MTERRRLNLSLSMASPLQREAWDILRAIPAGQRTDAVCLALCCSAQQDAMLNAVRTVIHEELGGISLKTEQPEQPQEAGDVGDDVLGFLLSLQGDE